MREDELEELRYALRTCQSDIRRQQGTIVRLKEQLSKEIEAWPAAGDQKSLD